MAERRHQKLTSQAADTPFLIGANLPWVEYGEFGRNAWHPLGGLSHRADLARVGDTLRSAAAHGVKAVRWFILCDGRAGIRFDESGAPEGPDESLFNDVGTALSLASDAGLQSFRCSSTFSGAHRADRQWRTARRPSRVASQC